MPEALKSRLDRRAWLAGALELLRERGIEGVKVEPLAAGLGVTKGSFYWHFTDRQDLVNSLPQFWAENQTGPVMARAAAVEGGPLDRLRAVAEYLGSEDPDRYDNTMRAWAQFDSDVAQTVREIDRRRLAFAEELFEAAGLTSKEAAIRARLFYFFDVGSQITGDVPGSLQERRRRSIRRVELLTADIV